MYLFWGNCIFRKREFSASPSSKHLGSGINCCSTPTPQMYLKSTSCTEQHKLNPPLAPRACTHRLSTTDTGNSQYKYSHTVTPKYLGWKIKHLKGCKCQHWSYQIWVQQAKRSNSKATDKMQWRSSQLTAKKTSCRGMTCHTVLDSSVTEGQHNPRSPSHPCCVGQRCSHGRYFWKGDVSPNFPRRNKVTDTPPPHRPPRLPGLHVLSISGEKKVLRELVSLRFFDKGQTHSFHVKGTVRKGKCLQTTEFAEELLGPLPQGLPETLETSWINNNSKTGFVVIL